MNEAEWLASTDPAAMLAALEGVLGPSWRSVAGDRKLRLFCCACRERWPGRSRSMYGYADDGAGIHNPPDVAGVWAADKNAGQPSQAVKAALLRCIIGNPFRPVNGWNMPRQDGEPDWYRILTWNDGTVRRLAEAICAANDFSADRLGVLADALEEAGCVDSECWSCLGYGNHLGAGPDRGNPDCSTCNGTGRLPHPLVEHLRSPGPHCRSCHVIDALTGKS